MIRINKPINPPECLSKEGAEFTRIDCENFDLNADAYISNDESFSLQDTYKKDAVKAALRVAQNNKCCYCEKDFRDDPIYVEHFRPFSSSRQAYNTKRYYPGYYWLAYSWENLYLACHPCNSGGKSDVFPLVDDNNRAHYHNKLISDEERLLIDPGKENPREHIRFRSDAPIGETDKGKETIKLLKLNNPKKRPNLIKARLEKLNILQMFRKVVERSLNDPGNVKKAREAEEYKQFLIQAIQPSSEFSSMAKDYLDDFLEQL